VSGDSSRSGSSIWRSIQTAIRMFGSATMRERLRAPISPPIALASNSQQAFWWGHCKQLGTSNPDPDVEQRDYCAPSRAGQPSYGQANVVCTLCHCAERETGGECQSYKRDVSGDYVTHSRRIRAVLPNKFLENCSSKKCVTCSGRSLVQP
jgi:hypothetical protein